jgi:hypothetical protein
LEAAAMADNGNAAEKPLGDLVNDVSTKASLLIKEEIELAKTEIAVKAKKLGIGAGMASAALVTLIYFTIFLFFGVAYLINDLFNWEDNIWAGFLIVAVFFLIVTILLVFIGLRLIRRGSPPTPDMAIEEAKATRAAFEEIT